MMYNFNNGLNRALRGQSRVAGELFAASSRPAVRACGLSTVSWKRHTADRGALSSSQADSSFPPDEYGVPSLFPWVLLNFSVSGM